MKKKYDDGVSSLTMRYCKIYNIQHVQINNE